MRKVSVLVGDREDGVVVADVLAELALRHQLLDVVGTSPTGLPERYLYSADKRYRYAFARWWRAEDDADLARTAVWVLLNPATGDSEGRRRPTLERCIEWSRGFSGLLIVNLFAYRHTDPRTLATAADPVGPANDDCLRTLTATAPRTVVAWGAKGRLHRRSTLVAPLLSAPLCLGVTARGEPRHPLYVPGNVIPRPWTPRR